MKRKFMVVSIISLILLIISIIIAIKYTILISNDISTGFYNSSSFISLTFVYFTATCLLILFIFSLIHDIKNKNNTPKNRTILYLLIPLSLFILVSFYYYHLESTMYTYSFDKVSVTFPKDMGKSYIEHSYEPKIGYKLWNNQNIDCNILFGKNYYLDKFDLIRNFKRASNKEIKLSDNITAFDNYGNVTSLNITNINGKEWFLYENDFEFKQYKMYGIIIDNNLYFIETINDKDNSEKCTRRINFVLNNIKYKK